MRTLLSTLCLLATVACGGGTGARPAGAPADPADVLIPYEKHVLDNGLTVVLHEDHKAPVISVAAWYHVGSKDERPGKTGFAHLFEHLLFEGSENHPYSWDQELDSIGATATNGTTWLDRTNYFETVPRNALDYALFMESERMGHFAGFLTPERLDVQRGVVQNEKRQRENRPYGKVWELLQRASFPEGHPYRWTTIGSLDDLAAATLDDVKEWFATYYGAANAVIALAGDFESSMALERVKHWFGDIPSGPPLPRRTEWIAARDASTRETLQDRVAQPRIYKSWNVPPDGAEDTELLQLAAQVLGGSAASRLDARLVHGERKADRVSSSVLAFELASVFVITADVRTDADTADVEAVLDEELRRLAQDGPTAAELARAKTAQYTGFVRGLERTGGFGGKAAVLAACETYQDDPGCYRRSLELQRRATRHDVRDAVRRWLAQGDHTLTVIPFPPYVAAATGADRSGGAPAVADYPDLQFPALQRARLTNGITVVLAERRELPLVHVRMLFDAGYAADQHHAPGTAAMTMQMLEEGTGRRGALALAADIEALGASLEASTGLDSAQVTLSALRERLAPSLDLMAEVILAPAFDAGEFARVQAQWLSRIAQEKTEPRALGLRVLPPLLFGAGHAYAIPFTGSGTEASIRQLTPDALREFHATWVRPDNATLLVTGDTTLESILPQLEARFGGWVAPAAGIPVKNLADVELPPKARVFLMDRPGAEQSVILAGLLAPPSNATRHLEIITMNLVLGGGFTARINQNLREDKHWSYGAYSRISSALGPSPYLFSAPVQTDRTADAIRELLREMRDFRGERPATDAEITRVNELRVRALPGRFEIGSAVLGMMTTLVRNGWPDDYVQSLKSRIEAQDAAVIRALARDLVQPDHVTWVVVGDLSKIESDVRALKLGTVKVIDPEGKVQP